MKPKNNIRIYTSLIAIWIVLLVAQFLLHEHLPGNILTFAVDSITPIPVIVLVVVFLIGLLMENREQKSRKQQLMFIKSSMFRIELRNLYISNFLALKSPPVTFSKIRTATLPELKQMREEANTVEYASLEAMEPVIMEYVNSQDVWQRFMNIALESGFQEIFHDMLYIMHFLSDVRTFKELNPEKLFIHEAANHEAMMQKVMKVLGDGIRRYLEYAIELKEKQPELFNQLVTDYELLARARA